MKMGVAMYYFDVLRLILEHILTDILIGCDSLVFCFIYTEVILPFRRKLSFFNYFSLNQMVLLLNFEYFDR